ncbi:RICIN domain-containing protein [Streptomyces fildesensis]|uniref:RICIN domain-containing protein n=1 Tax=Streptomyces fildesensis TaxID=375757 RepID=A0ABW8C9Y5_9ACTN
MRIKIGFPGVISVESDDVADLFRRRRTSRGPFLLMGRDSGLALDTAWRGEGESPILWPAHAHPHQLWYFQRTHRRNQFLIVSVDNGLVLDARQGTELRRWPVMRSPSDDRHQHWRLHPTKDATGFIIESVHSGHVLDVPEEAGRKTRTPPVLWERHGEMNQQFLIMTPSGGPA